MELGFQTHFVYELATLLAVLDPTAAIPVYLAATAGLSRRQSLQVAAYAVGTAFLVLLFFICAGQLLLEALKIPMASFQLSGSIVLLLFGLKLVLGQIAVEIAAMPSTATMAQRAIYPLAIPTIAGAGAMLTVVLLTDNTHEIGRRAGAYDVPHGGRPRFRLLRPRSLQTDLSPDRAAGVEVISRVSGLVLASIAVSGIITAIKLSFKMT